MTAVVSQTYRIAQSITGPPANSEAPEIYQQTAEGTSKTEIFIPVIKQQIVLRNLFKSDKSKTGLIIVLE